ncbi:site-specific DNA-methyltransferase [Exiguobacterium sp.]|uniref:site-specific DNA-methyltransferase n=1 Tax=Exiguobacterium sp. TaxID=44751 RepID=UPI0028A9A328|nr:site-specific DNA-methyltransferase [Exiguobacterium sp.]
MKYKKSLHYGLESAANIIFKGDNIDVLNNIMDDYKGRVDCIYIDPPYNNDEEYIHYNDSDGFDLWMEKLTNILPLLFDLLSEKGSLWISIDDGELHYLKVAADKIIGRKNFIHTIVWEHRTSRENRKAFSNNHEYILVYAKNPNEFKKKRNLLEVDENFLKKFKNPDNDPRGTWQSVTASVQAGHAVASQFYTIIAPNGKKHNPPLGRCWAYNEQRMLEEIKNNNIWFGKDGNGVPRIKKFLSDSKRGLTPETIWFAEEVGTTNQAKKQLKALFKDQEVFDTPKPEALIKRILEISTNEGDLVLDAYLGSGTTAVVAQKINRRYLGIEVGQHVLDIVLPRLNKTIDNLFSEENSVDDDNLGFELWL